MDININKRYTRDDKYIAKLPAEPCNCICHHPGRVVMHCIPCCDGTYTQFTDRRKEAATAMK